MSTFMQHNEANILVLPTHCLGEKVVNSIIDSYLLSGFDGEVRNQKRLKKMKELEEKYTRSCHSITPAIDFSLV